MGGSSPYPGRTQSHPCPSHLTRGQEEGGAAWIEVCPRNTMEEEEGDLGGMGGAIFKLGKTVSAFISTLSAGGGKGPIVQGCREGEGEGRWWHNGGDYAGAGRGEEGGGGASPSQLAY